MLSLSPLLVCLLYACSDLISSLHRQGQARERRKTRGISVGIEISKSYPTPKAANTQQPKAANTIPKSTCQHYPKIHLSVSSLHSCSTETPRKVSTVEAVCHIHMYLTPQNSSGRTKTPHSQPPHFKPP